MTQVNNIRKPDYAGALTTAAAGGAVWSACEYFFKKHPYINDNKILKDTFVKQMEESLQAINDAKTIETINFFRFLSIFISPSYYQLIRQYVLLNLSFLIKNKTTTKCGLN